MKAKFDNKIFVPFIVFVLVLGYAGLTSTRVDAQTADQAPIITEGDAISVTMAENGLPIPFKLTLHATDADGDTLSWYIIKPADHGMAYPGYSGYSPIINYTPNDKFTGTDSFVLQVNDTLGGTDSIVINVNVIPPTAGALDPTFGVGGTAFAQFSFTGGANVYGNAVAIQPDGKVIVAGTSSYDFALARFNPDGSLDLGFGVDGKVVTDFGGSRDDYGYAVAIQADGKIIVAGSTKGYEIPGDNGWDADFALARYSSNGSLDTSFGTNGLVTTEIITVQYGNSNAEAKAVIIQPDGKILAAGIALVGVGSPPFFYGYTDFALVRYNIDGSLDSNFGSGGIVDSDLGRSASAVALQPDGKIVVGGVGSVQFGTNAFAVARYNSDGSADTTFGTGGGVITDIGHFDARPSSLFIQPDGKIVATGINASIDNLEYGFALTRYESDGALDPTFGVDGTVTTYFGYGGSWGGVAVLQPDGKVVMIGYTSGMCSMARYNPDGSLDNGFGTIGKVFIEIQGGSCTTIALQSDGKIILGGSGLGWGYGPNAFAAARFDSQLVAISGNAGIDGATLSYTDGSPKTTTSDYSGYYSFIVPIGWSGTVAPSHPTYYFFPDSRDYSNVMTYKTNEDYTISTQPEYALTVVSENGTVEKNPEKVSYHEGDQVQLTAVPNPGWRFVEWTGDLTGTNNPDMITIHGNSMVTAVYSKIEYKLTITAKDQTKTYGESFILLGSDFTVNGLQEGDVVSSVTLTSAGAQANANVGAYSITPYAAQGVGLYKYTITYQDGTLTVNPKALTITAKNSTAQYSDPIPPITVTFNGFVLGQGVGNLSGTLYCTTIATSSSSPGSYLITCSGLTSTNYVITYQNGTIKIKQEDAGAAYTGPMLISTGCGTCGTATVPLQATISDSSGIASSDPKYDPYAGDITKATITFVNRDAGNSPLCTANVVPMMEGNSIIGIATCNWTARIGNADWVDFTIGVVVGGYYTRDNLVDNALVTVSKPTGYFITAGGNLLNLYPGGYFAGTNGLKTSFSLNIKWNPQYKNLQGRVKIIILNNGRVYQILTNTLYSLVAKPYTVSDPNGTAELFGKANLTDVTNPLNPILIVSNATLRVVMTDKGEPGTKDMIGCTLWNSDMSLLFSSNWDNGKTIQQVLNAGNLIIH